MMILILIITQFRTWSVVRLEALNAFRSHWPFIIAAVLVGGGGGLMVTRLLLKGPYLTCPTKAGRPDAIDRTRAPCRGARKAARSIWGFQQAIISPAVVSKSKH